MTTCRGQQSSTGFVKLECAEILNALISDTNRRWDLTVSTFAEPMCQHTTQRMSNSTL